MSHHGWVPLIMWAVTVFVGVPLFVLYRSVKYRKEEEIRLKGLARSDEETTEPEGHDDGWQWIMVGNEDPEYYYMTVRH